MADCDWDVISNVTESDTYWSVEDDHISLASVATGAVDSVDDLQSDDATIAGEEEDEEFSSSSEETLGEEVGDVTIAACSPPASVSISQRAEFCGRAKEENYNGIICKPPLEHLIDISTPSVTPRTTPKHTEMISVLHQANSSILEAVKDVDSLSTAERLEVAEKLVQIARDSLTKVQQTQLCQSIDSPDTVQDITIRIQCVLD